MNVTAMNFPSGSEALLRPGSCPDASRATAGLCQPESNAGPSALLPGPQLTARRQAGSEHGGGASSSLPQIQQGPARAARAEASEGHTLPGGPTARELWARYRAAGPGDASEEQLLTQYVPLVKNVVGRLAINLPPHIETEDLYSAGMIGLLQALRAYNPQTNTCFEAYARLRIRGAVIDELRRMDWAPRSVHLKARKVQQAMELLEQQYGRVATEEEMAEALDISVEEYRRWLDDIRPAAFVCLDAVHRDEDGEEASPHEVIYDPAQEEPSEAAVRAERARLIAECIQQLPPLHQKVLALYYFEGLRLREIAAASGLCESRICQIHTQAILTIRSYLAAREAAPANVVAV